MTDLFVWCVRSHVHVLAHTQTYLHVLFVARMKSHIQPIFIFLFHRIFFFQSFVYVYERHLWIMRYMSIAYRRHWLLRPEGCPKWKIGFVGFLHFGFQFQYFLRILKKVQLFLWYFVVMADQFSGLDTRANRTCKIVHTCDLKHACRFAHEKGWY